MSATKVKRRRFSFSPYGFLCAAVAIYGLFVVYPIVETIILSFTSWNGYSPIKEFVGLRNYVMIFTKDPVFWVAIKNNVIWATLSILIPVGTALILAVVVDGLPRLSGLFRGAFFVPTVVPTVVVATIWSWIYNPMVGLLNTLLGSVGLEKWTHVWLGEPDTALYSVLAAGSWRYVGFCMVILLAGLRGIPDEIRDAARIDGASEWQFFRRITVPMLRDVITVLVVFSTIGSFRLFDLVYVMTWGGPNNASDVLATHMYTQAFRNNLMGYGAALSVLLLSMVTVVTVVQMRVLQRQQQ